MMTGERPPKEATEAPAWPVLVVDDEPDNLAAFRFNFKRSFRVLTAGSGAEGLEVLRREEVAAIVTDQRMPRMSGLEFLGEARAIQPDAVPIILTAYTDVDVLIDAINQGQIYRYITKPWDAKEVRGILLQAVERYHLRRENARLTEQLRQYAGYLSQELHGAFDFGQLVGESAALRAVLQRVEQVAKTQSTVLLRGETGTGKELVAHAIHINSPRESKPFVRVSCAALASGVLESELFGHERGAFTGAMARRQGRFELAEGGTLFLDEVGDLPMEVQIKLLRVLQEREFERVGGTETIRVDARLISATNRNLEALVSEGRFREDLYYRLNVFPIYLPPLRERIDDIPRLCEHFLAKLSRRSPHHIRAVEPAALELLQRYPFPGNVRELENLIERAVILARGPEISGGDLDFGRRATAAPMAAVAPTSGPQPVVSAPVPAAASNTAPSLPTLPTPTGPRTLQNRLSEQERTEIVTAIEQCEGNIARAARHLGINRSTLYYRMRKHDLLHLLPNKPDAEPAAAEPEE